MNYDFTYFSYDPYINIVPSQQYWLQIAKAFKMGVSVLKSKDRDAASRLFQIFKEVSRDNF